MAATPRTLPGWCSPGPSGRTPRWPSPPCPAPPAQSPTSGSSVRVRLHRHHEQHGEDQVVRGAEAGDLRCPFGRRSGGAVWAWMAGPRGRRILVAVKGAVVVTSLCTQRDGSRAVALPTPGAAGRRVRRVPRPRSTSRRTARSSSSPPSWSCGSSPPWSAYVPAAAPAPRRDVVSRS